MEMMQRMFKVSLLMSLICLVGCASGSGAKQRYFWPRPPEEPKIEYLGAYHGNIDLVEKSILTAITGVDDDVVIDYPMAVAADGVSKVFVTDLAQKVVEFDFISKKVSLFGGGGTAMISKPSGIALDGDGNVYVGDMAKPTISVFSREGKALSSIDLSSQAKSIGLLAIDRERKRMVVPDPTGNKVFITDLNGKIIKTIVSWGGEKESDNFNMPGGAAFDLQGNIIVADTMHARIVRFTPDGEFLSKFGRRGDGSGDFSLIKGVAVDSEGHIYVTDSKAHRLYIFNDKGEALLVFGVLSEASQMLIGSFALPLGIFIDRNDAIYIADRMNKRFQVFQYMNSSYLAKNPVTKDTVIAKPFEPKVAGEKPASVPAGK